MLVMTKVLLGMAIQLSEGRRVSFKYLVHQGCGKGRSACHGEDDQNS